MNLVVGGMMLGGKGHKNICIRSSNRCGIAVREIDAAVGQTNVVNDALDCLAGICRRIDCST